MRMHWGVAITAVYTTFALSTVGFVVFAMTQPVDLVSDDYYAQSLRYDERMAGQQNVAALDGVVRSTLATDQRAVVVSLPEAQWVGATGTVRLYRPSSAGLDRLADLTLDSAGEQRVSVEGLAPGRWRVQIEWRWHERPYYYERELDLP